MNYYNILLLYSFSIKIKKKFFLGYYKSIAKNSILGIGNNIRNSCRETYLEDLRTCPWRRRRACIRAHCLPNQDPLIPLVIISQWCLTKYDHHFPPLKLSSVFSLRDTIHKFENLIKTFFLCKEDRKLTFLYTCCILYTMLQKNYMTSLLLRSYSRSVACAGTFSDLPTKAHNGLCCVWERRPPSHWDPIYQWFIMTAYCCPPETWGTL